MFASTWLPYMTFASYRWYIVYNRSIFGYYILTGKQIILAAEIINPESEFLH